LQFDTSLLLAEQQKQADDFAASQEAWLKVSLVLNPDELAAVPVEDGKPRVKLRIRLPDRKLSADIVAQGAGGSPRIGPRRHRARPGLPCRWRHHRGGGLEHAAQGYVRDCHAK
jgi:hypothetical protein